MSVPVDPAQFLVAAAVMALAVAFVVWIGRALFAAYVAAGVEAHRKGHRIGCWVWLCLGGMALGALGWLAFQGLMALAGWLL